MLAIYLKIFYPNLLWSWSQKVDGKREHLEQNVKDSQQVYEQKKTYHLMIAMIQSDENWDDLYFHPVHRLFNLSQKIFHIKVLLFIIISLLKK